MSRAIKKRPAMVPSNYSAGSDSDEEEEEAATRASPKVEVGATETSQRAKSEARLAALPKVIISPIVKARPTEGSLPKLGATLPSPIEEAAMSAAPVPSTPAPEGQAQTTPPRAVARSSHTPMGASKGAGMGKSPTECNQWYDKGLLAGTIYGIDLGSVAGFEAGFNKGFARGFAKCKQEEFKARRRGGPYDEPSGFSAHKG